MKICGHSDPLVILVIHNMVMPAQILFIYNDKGELD